MRAGEVGVDDDERRAGRRGRGRRRAAGAAGGAQVVAGAHGSQGTGRGGYADRSPRPVRTASHASRQILQPRAAPARHAPTTVFAFFADARNLEAIDAAAAALPRAFTPEPIEMGLGALIQYRLRLHGVPVRWLTSIPEWDPPHRFVDVQLRGPVRAVAPHAHLRARRRDGGHADERRRPLPRSASGRSASSPTGSLVRRDVEAIFDFRAAAIPALLTAG